jgi:transcriptional regulator with XRE-family HTH domain
MSAGAAVLERAGKMPAPYRPSASYARTIIAEIETARLARKLTVRVLAQAAGISERFYRQALAGQCQPRAAVLRRLARVVRVGVAADHGARVDLALKQLALEALEQRFAAAGHPAREAAALALYTAHVELGFDQTGLALLRGVTKQAVSKTVRACELRRDDPALDRLIEGVLS